MFAPGRLSGDMVPTPEVGPGSAASADIAFPPSAPFLLAKTPESFRLPDLYAMEASLRSEADGGGYRCVRTDVDPATGSCLLRLDLHLGGGSGGGPGGSDGGRSGPTRPSFSGPPPPSFLSRCDFIAECLASGRDAASLLEDVRINGGGLAAVEDWALDYLCLAPNGPSSSAAAVAPSDRAGKGGGRDTRGGRKRPGGGKGYTSRSLLCCVSHSLAGRPALDPRGATQRLVVIEASDGLFLARKIAPPEETPPVVDGEEGRARPEGRKSWAGRPFQYSSAVNPTVAEVVVDVLLDLARARRRSHPSPSGSGGGRERGGRPTLLLDPTCGSGTFLARAVERGADAVGWDVNPACVDGSERNLQFMFGEAGGGGPMWTVDERDAASPPDGRCDCDCVAANLPWGINTPSFLGENGDILAALARTVPPGTPCAFVFRGGSHGDDLRRAMEGLGYEIRGKAHVPPRDFRPPGSAKKRRQRKKAKEDDGGGVMISRAMGRNAW